MKISKLFDKKKTVFSLEVFPPKKSGGAGGLYPVLESLCGLNPAYISVTCGAGGSVTDGNPTVEIASLIKNKFKTEVMAHLTCVNSDKEDVLTVLDELKTRNIDNILVLRGDKNPDTEPKTRFKYASELAEFIRFIDTDNFFGLSGACYPEGHIEAVNLNEDLKNLKKKAEAGVETLVTQLFFDNACFYNFREKIRLLDINVPVSAGIMPVTSKKQIERMVSMCGASLPPKFVKMIARYENSQNALTDAGIAYAVDQIVDLISNGVEGIHLYTMNSPYVAQKISESVVNLL